MDKHPEFYLDEFVEELFSRTGVLYHPMTIWRVLKKKLGYSLKVYSSIAKQRCERERTKYRSAIRRLVKHPEQSIFLDEAAKNKKASRRNKAWGRIGENLELEQWFRDESNYTLIAACNIKGFIPSACYLKSRKKEKETATRGGASGTIDQIEFEKYFRRFIFPLLGSYEKNEPHSIVILDNASIHFSPAIKKRLKKKGHIYYICLRTRLTSIQSKKCFTSISRR